MPTSGVWSAVRYGVRQSSKFRGLHLHSPAENVFTSIPDATKALEQKIQARDLRIANAISAQHESKQQARRVAVKDNIVSKHGASTAASSFLRYHYSPYAAHVVEKLNEADASIIGKTNMDEFGMGSHSTNSYFGTVRNQAPFDRHSVGGSSGGSAVAIAAGYADVSLGTDTGGSVRLPAAYTGVVGFKPSYGLVSRWGVIPYANSLDTVGILASSVAKVDEYFQPTILDTYDPRDPTSLPTASRMRMRAARRQSPKAQHNGRPAAADEWNDEASQRPICEESSKTASIPSIAAAPEELPSLGLQGQKRPMTARSQRDPQPVLFANTKIGVPLDYNIDELHPGIRQVWTDVLEVLQLYGATIVPISLPNTKHALSAYYILAPAEAASNLAKYDGVRFGNRSGPSDGAGDVLYSKSRGEGFGDEVKRRILLGSYTLSSEAIDNYFIKAQKIRRLVQRDFDRVFAIPHPLRPEEQFDLSDMDDSIPLDDKLGPPQVDLILCPTAPTPAPTLEDVTKASPLDSYMNDVFTVPASLAGLPAISIPFTIPRSHHSNSSDTVREIPSFAGIQIIGQYGDDYRVLSVAQKLEHLIPLPSSLLAHPENPPTPEDIQESFEISKSGG